MTRWHRIYFAAVGIFAIWVGLWGYLFPAEIARAIPWAVPPLHARFIGSMYLSGAVLMFGALAAKRLAAVSIAVPMAFVWTGMLGIVSFLNLAEFDFARAPVWFWFFAYVVYPLAGIWLAWRYGGGETPERIALQPWLRAWLGLQGIVCVVLSAFLFFSPQAASERWPWAIPPLLAQIYSGPFLSYGVGSLLLVRRNDWGSAKLPIASMIVFAVLVLAASLLHGALFTPGSLSAVLWFGGFASATVLAGIGLVFGKAASRA